jgi:hypothetical protein
MSSNKTHHAVRFDIDNKADDGLWPAESYRSVLRFLYLARARHALGMVPILPDGSQGRRRRHDGGRKPILTVLELVEEFERKIPAKKTRLGHASVQSQSPLWVINVAS